MFEILDMLQNNQRMLQLLYIGLLCTRFMPGSVRLWSTLGLGHAFLGIIFNQKRLYIGLFLLIGIAGISMPLGFGAKIALGLFFAHAMLFYGSLVYHSVSMLHRVFKELQITSEFQAKIARILCMLGLSLCVINLGAFSPFFSLGYIQGLSPFWFGMVGLNLYCTPISFRTKASFLKNIAIIALSLLVSALGCTAMMWGVTHGLFLCLLTGYLGIALISGSIAVSAWRQMKIKGAQISRLRQAGNFAELDDFERRESAFFRLISEENQVANIVNSDLVKAKAMFDKIYSTSQNKKSIFLKILKHSNCSEDLAAYMIGREKNPKLHIELLNDQSLRTDILTVILNDMTWLNGLNGILSGFPVAKKRLLNYLHGHHTRNRDNLYLQGVIRAAAVLPRDQVSVAYIKLRASVLEKTKTPQHAEDRNAQARSMGAIKANNENSVLVELFRSKAVNNESDAEIVEKIHKEIRGRLLDMIVSDLKKETFDSQGVIKTSRAQEIIVCIEKNKENLVRCEESALAGLRGLIADNNVMFSMIAWRMYDPKAPTGFYPSLLLKNESSEPVFTTIETANGARTQKTASEEIRKDTAFCYLKAMQEDGKNKNQDAWQRFVGMISSAGRANNDNDIGLTSDERTCFPGFKTRLGEFLGGVWQEKIKERIGQKIECAFLDEMKKDESSLSLQEKTNLYDALMFFENKDLKTLFLGDHCRASDTCLQRKFSEEDRRNAVEAHLLTVRKNFIKKTFSEDSLENSGIHNISKKVANDLKDDGFNVTAAQIKDDVELCLLQMYCNKQNLTKAYCDHVLNKAEAHIEDVRVNPYGKDKPKFSVFENKDGYQGADPRLKTIMRKQFVSNSLSWVLYDALKRNTQKTKEEMELIVQEVVEVLKEEENASWSVEQLESLESKLLESYLSYVLYKPELQNIQMHNEGFTEVRKEKKKEKDMLVQSIKTQNANEWTLENISVLENKLGVAAPVAAAQAPGLINRGGLFFGNGQNGADQNGAGQNGAGQTRRLFLNE